MTKINHLVALATLTLITTTLSGGGSTTSTFIPESRSIWDEATIEHALTKRARILVPGSLVGASLIGALWAHHKIRSAKKTHDIERYRHIRKVCLISLVTSGALTLAVALTGLFMSKSELLTFDESYRETLAAEKAVREKNATQSRTEHTEEIALFEKYRDKALNDLRSELSANPALLGGRIRAEDLTEGNELAEAVKKNVRRTTISAPQSALDKKSVDLMAKSLQALRRDVEKAALTQSRALAVAHLITDIEHALTAEAQEAAKTNPFEAFNKQIFDACVGELIDKSRVITDGMTHEERDKVKQERLAAVKAEYKKRLAAHNRSLIEKAQKEVATAVEAKLKEALAADVAVETNTPYQAAYEEIAAQALALIDDAKKASLDVTTPEKITASTNALATEVLEKYNQLKTELAESQALADYYRSQNTCRIGSSWNQEIDFSRINNDPALLKVIQLHKQITAAITPTKISALKHYETCDALRSSDPYDVCAFIDKDTANRSQYISPYLEGSDYQSRRITALAKALNNYEYDAAELLLKAVPLETRYSYYYNFASSEAETLRNLFTQSLKTTLTELGLPADAPITGLPLTAQQIYRRTYIHPLIRAAYAPDFFPGATDELRTKLRKALFYIGMHDNGKRDVDGKPNPVEIDMLSTTRRSSQQKRLSTFTNFSQLTPASVARATTPEELDALLVP